MWSTLVRLGVAGIVDEAVPRRADAAASVGTYLALACANRIVDPCSKRGFADWWATTAGQRWVRLSRAAVDHRRFWDAMDRLGEAELRVIETRLGRAMVAEFGLDLTGLALDMTNFATFIDTGNERAPIAQRGKAKQKRTDLRLVGLALVLTRDGGVPVISHAYPGDRPDVTQFQPVVDELVARYRDLVAGVESLTVVYDAGQNSGDNHAVVEAHGHRVRRFAAALGSPRPAGHPRPRLPARRRRPLPRAALRRHHGHRVGGDPPRGADPFGEPARQAVPRPGPDPGQGAAPAHRTAGPTRPRPTRRDRATVQAEIATIRKPRWVADIITVTLTGEAPAELRLTWRTDTRARTRLEQRLFGKRILFTNRDWPVPDVVAAYRSQSDAEFGFRQLKDPHVVSFSPMHHWTDSKIRVHVFYCVLALAVAHLMRRHADQPACTCPCANCSTSSPASKKPSCSTTTAARDAPACSACSPT